MRPQGARRNQSLLAFRRPNPMESCIDALVGRGGDGLVTQGSRGQQDTELHTKGRKHMQTGTPKAPQEISWGSKGLLFEAWGGGPGGPFGHLGDALGAKGITFETQGLQKWFPSMSLGGAPGGHLGSHLG